MLLHHYWEKALGSKVKVKILRVLCKYPSKRFTIRELARLIHCTHTPVLKSIPDLQEMNLIRLEKHGTANLLTFNTKSYLFSLLHSLFIAETSTKQELKKELATLLPETKMVALFGSICAGTETAHSDIDLLIVTNTKKKIKKEIDEMRKNMTDKFGNLLSPKIFTEAEFKANKNKPFAKDLINSYEIISGKDLIKKWWTNDKN